MDTGYRYMQEKQPCSRNLRVFLDPGCPCILKMCARFLAILSNKNVEHPTLSG